jgi:hypothetical protein
MFRFDEDLMAERLSDRCHIPVASAGGSSLPHRTVATVNGLSGPVLVFWWTSHRDIKVSGNPLLWSNPLNL